MTPKQQRFVEEYLIDLNATQAAKACGVELKRKGDGFYIYFLIDGRDSSIFYIGKGKGGRLLHHRREAKNPSSINQTKAQRILDCGDDFAEVVFADGLDEVSAYRLEKELITALRHTSLTNIASGSVHPLESLLIGIDRNITAIRPYEDWKAGLRPWQVDAVFNISGSIEAFYQMYVDSFIELRAKVIERLNSIEGKSDGTGWR